MLNKLGEKKIQQNKRILTEVRTLSWWCPFILVL